MGENTIQNRVMSKFCNLSEDAVICTIVISVIFIFGTFMFLTIGYFPGKEVEKFNSIIENEKIYIGQTKQEVIDIIGEPLSYKRKEDKGSFLDEWYYQYGLSQGHLYLYFDREGNVSSIEASSQY